MASKLLAAPAVILLTALAVVTADFCSEGQIEIDGNWFCQPVTAITYTNVGTPGSYDDVIDMSNGACSTVPFAFSGPIAPLNEEISLHFRGPIQLKQFAAYSPVLSAAKKRDVSSVQARRHGHQHDKFHKRAGTDDVHGVHRRQDVTATINGQVVSWVNNRFGETAAPSASRSTSSSTVWVTATVDGQVVSWVNNWLGETATPSVKGSVTSSVQMVTATIDGQVVSWPNNWFGGASSPTPAPTTETAPAISEPANDENVVVPSIPTATSEAPVTSPPVTASTVDNSTTYERIGYYDSASQTLDNLVFLGNYGGQGSGVFDDTFGASLSYVNCDGTRGASSPQILGDVLIPSTHEVAIMTSNECTDGSCGYSRPGAVAYHGFQGSDKVFMFEFAMPMDGQEGFEGNQPAIWALNAKIPRTDQYGNASCSCWESGCGEFDIVEALIDGSPFLKSTLHDNTSGGDSDYIARPTSATMKLAVVFSSSSSTIHIQVLPDSTDFSPNFTAGELEGMCASPDGSPVSLFTIS